MFGANFKAEVQENENSSSNDTRKIKNEELIGILILEI